MLKVSIPQFVHLMNGGCVEVAVPESLQSSKNDGDELPVWVLATGAVHHSFTTRIVRRGATLGKVVLSRNRLLSFVSIGRESGHNRAALRGQAIHPWHISPYGTGLGDN